MQIHGDDLDDNLHIKVYNLRVSTFSMHVYLHLHVLIGLEHHGLDPLASNHRYHSTHVQYNSYRITITDDKY